MDESPPTLGQQIFYVTQDRVVMPAVVTAIDHTGEYWRVNLTLFTPRGIVKPKEYVLQAYHDGERPRVLNKWVHHLEDLADSDVIIPELNTRPYEKRYAE